MKSSILLFIIEYYNEMCKSTFVCALIIFGNFHLSLIFEGIFLMNSPDHPSSLLVLICLSFVDFKFTAVGCTNMIPPDNAWLKRANNDIVIGCYLSQQTWQLKCDGHEWKGLVGECDESCEDLSNFREVVRVLCSRIELNSNILSYLK